MPIGRTSVIGSRLIRVSALAVGAILVADVSWLWSSQRPVQALSWEFRGAPTEAMDIAEIVIDPQDDLVWYVATGTGLYVTWDAGDSWTEGIEGNIGAIEVDPNNSDVVYASVGSDLHVSTDQGVSWHILFPFPDLIPGTPQDAPTFIDSILVSSSEGTIVVGLSTTFHSARIYVSEDGGNLWEIAFESPQGLHFWDLAEIPSNGYWFFCTEDSAHTVDPVVMRSRDRGATWEEMAALTGFLTSGHGLNLAVHPWTEVVFFLSEATVLRYSVDFGDSWPIDYEGRGFGSALLLDANCPNRVFGGEIVRGVSLGGVFASDNGSQSFSFEGLDGNSISSLAMDGNSLKVLAAGYGTGLWQAEIDGIIECSQDVLLFADGFESGDTYRWIQGSGR